MALTLGEKLWSTGGPSLYDGRFPPLPALAPIRGGLRLGAPVGRDRGASTETRAPAAPQALFLIHFWASAPVR